MLILYYNVFYCLAKEGKDKDMFCLLKMNNLLDIYSTNVNRNTM